MEKLAIHVLGADLVDRLYNWSDGFHDLTGRIVFPDKDSIFLLLTSSRTYSVQCSGDLVVEYHDDFIFSGFTIGWTKEAAAHKSGTGELTITNPDMPEKPSMFAVEMGKAAIEVIHPQTKGGRDISKEEARRRAQAIILDNLFRSHRQTIDLAGSKSDGSSSTNPYYNRAADPAFGDHTDKNAFWNPDGAAIGQPVGHEYGHGVLDSEYSHRIGHGVDFHVVVHEPYRRPFFGDFNYGTEGGAVSEGGICDTLDSLLGNSGTRLKALLLDTKSPEDLPPLPVFFLDGDSLPDRPYSKRKVDMQDIRDFDQLKRTHELTLADIETIAAQAAALGIDTAAYLERRDTALGIDTSPYFKHREAALPGLAGLASRLAEGGSHPIDSTEAAAIESVFTETMRIKSELQSLVFHYHHYQEMFATHQKQESELADRVRKLRYADGALDNRIADAYIVYAANPEPVLAQSKAAFEEVFQAVKRGDLKAAHQAANQARSFSTREHFLGVLLRNGTLTAAN